MKVSYENRNDRNRDFSGKRYHRDGDREWKRRFPRDSETSDSEESDRPRRSFRKDHDDNDSVRPRRPFRRDHDDDSERPRRPFRKDHDDDSERPRRPFRRNHDDDRGEGFRRERRSFGDRTSYRRKEHPRYIEDSPIIDEIVKKRREEGRSSDRKPKVLSLEWNEERGLIRLNKYIANAGVCSRREADRLIEAGAVTVNGEVVTELGTKIQPTDEVRYGDKVLQREKPVYILLNKPKDYITTTSDEYDRKNVMNLVAGACPQRVYPVGRLDRNTTGLLLITNDGELAKKLTHPRYGVKKIYQVELDKSLSQEDFQQIISGLELADGFIAPDELAYVGESRREIGITLHSGKNRIVRRIFEHLGYEVVKLDRVYYAGLTKKDLPRGEWRFLRKDEVNILKMSL
ncbi:MAG: pseudouridine synthase [Bacteroidales bacterium]|nr:pseudouridine synthase [Bacteroidales bacterium]